MRKITGVLTKMEIENINKNLGKCVRYEGKPYIMNAAIKRKRKGKLYYQAELNYMTETIAGGIIVVPLTKVEEVLTGCSYEV